MSSSSTPCAACKFQRRKCTQDCVFAPYFPPDHIQKFANIHNIFGASNVSKILRELPTSQREEAVNSLAYEAEAWLREPVYGCVGYIFILQQRLKLIQAEISTAKKELSTYIGPQAMLPIIQTQSYFPQLVNASSSMIANYNTPMMSIPTGSGHDSKLVIQETQQQQTQCYPQEMYEAQQWVYEQQHPNPQQLQEQELLGFNSGLDNLSINSPPQYELHQAQLLLQPPQEQVSQQPQYQQQQQSSGSEEGKSGLQN